MPGSEIMLELCDFLKINVNELLSGEGIMAEFYDKRAEENLLAMKQEMEEKNRQLLRAEYRIVFPAVLAGLALVFVACIVSLPMWVRVVLLTFFKILFTEPMILWYDLLKDGYICPANRNLERS